VHQRFDILPYSYINRSMKLMYVKKNLITLNNKRTNYSILHVKTE